MAPATCIRACLTSLAIASFSPAALEEAAKDPASRNLVLLKIPNGRYVRLDSVLEQSKIDFPFLTEDEVFSTATQYRVVGTTSDTIQVSGEARTITIVELEDTRYGSIIPKVKSEPQIDFLKTPGKSKEQELRARLDDVFLGKDIEKPEQLFADLFKDTLEGSVSENAAAADQLLSPFIPDEGEVTLVINTLLLSDPEKAASTVLALREAILDSNLRSFLEKEIISRGGKGLTTDDLLSIFREKDSPLSSLITEKQFSSSGAIELWGGLAERIRASRTALLPKAPQTIQTVFQAISVPGASRKTLAGFLKEGEELIQQNFVSQPWNTQLKKAATAALSGQQAGDSLSVILKIESAAGVRIGKIQSKMKLGDITDAGEFLVRSSKFKVISIKLDPESHIPIITLRGK